MNFCKLSVIFSAAALVFVGANASTIKEKHLANYTLQCLENWFYPNHSNASLQNLSKKIARDIQSSSNYESEWNWQTFTFDISYSSDYVGQLIRGATLDFIKDNAYQYARELTSTHKAQKISTIVYDQVLSFFSQSLEIGRGVLSRFIGNDLRNLVRQINQQLDSYAPAQPVHVTPATYASSDCMVCMESFHQVSRVYLKPCGHDICVDCAERWFFNENKNTCPKCRQTIDKKALRAAINEAVLAVAMSNP